jgi:hypothetical protein
MISGCSISGFRGGLVEDADDVPGFPAGGIGDLVPAARAIGGKQRIRRGGPYFW